VSEALPQAQVPNRRSLLLTAVWIGALLVFGFLVWFFTQQPRTRFLVERVNRALAVQGESRRVTEPWSGRRSSGFGTWFSLTRNQAGAGVEGSSIFVFTLMRGSSAAACAALVDSSGAVEGILPLSEHAAQTLEGLPDPVYRFYIDRIEKAAGLRGSK
jgi:hypothetical protein